MLTITPEDVHREEKNIFKKFSCWFFRERALRYILLGNMTDKLSYINYKNDIMIHYINKPEKWLNNIKRQQIKRKTCERK